MVPAPRTATVRIAPSVIAPPESQDVEEYRKERKEREHEPCSGKAYSGGLASTTSRTISLARVSCSGRTTTRQRPAADILREAIPISRRQTINVSARFSEPPFQISLEGASSSQSSVGSASSSTLSLRSPPSFSGNSSAAISS